jgi:hypothetical protein
VFNFSEICIIKFFSRNQTRSNPFDAWFDASQDRLKTEYDGDDDDFTNWASKRFREMSNEERMVWEFFCKKKLFCFLQEWASREEQ